MAQQTGFMIYNKFYPLAKTFRLGDRPLACEVTGLTWPEFVRRAAEAELDEVADDVVVVGMIAVSFWQKNPHMQRPAVVRAVEKIPDDDVEFIIGVDEEDDASPPEHSGVASSTSSNASEDTPEDTE